MLEHRDRNERIVDNSICERGGDDVPVLIDAQVELAPVATLVRGLVLVSLPLPVAQDLQTGGVDDEMERASALSETRDLNIETTT